MNFEILKGKTLKEIIKTEDEITFIADNGLFELYKLTLVRYEDFH